MWGAHDGGVFCACSQCCTAGGVQAAGCCVSPGRDLCFPLQDPLPADPHFPGGGHCPCSAHCLLRSVSHSVTVIM